MGDRPAKMGRPTKLTRATEAVILEAVRGGLPLSKSAALAGINRVTLAEWIARGSAGDAVYSDFANKCELAHAAFLADMLRVVRASAQGGDNKSPDPDNAKWMLERRSPEDFGRLDRSKVQVTATVAQGEIDVRKLSKERLVQLTEILREAGAADDDEPE